MIAFATSQDTSRVPAGTPTPVRGQPGHVPASIRDTERLGDEIARLAAHLHAATHRLLVLIRRFDERDSWTGGFRSCAHWLSWRIGLGLGAAREHVRVARALGELPRISGGMERGERERHWHRSVELNPDDDGSWVLGGRLDPEVGAALARALDAGARELHGTSTEASPAQKRADALGLLAEVKLGDVPAGTSSGRPQVVLHVQAEDGHGVLTDEDRQPGLAVPSASPGGARGGVEGGGGP